MIALQKWTCKVLMFLLAAMVLAGAAHGVTIADFGIADPVPGTYDIAQLSTNGDTKFPDSNGLNYYDNSGTPPGQTFTTGTNSAGYALNSLYIRYGGINDRS